MINLLWETDVHLADESPQSRTDSWRETVLGKLKQVGDIAKNNDVSMILNGGDMFHVKSPGRNSHQLVRAVADLRCNLGIPTAGNVGNHDVKWGDIRYLNESPLGVLFETGVFKRCYDDNEIYIIQGNDGHIRTEYLCKEGIFLRHSEDDLVIRIVGIPYHGTSYDMSRFNIPKGEEDYLVALAHVLASEQGGSMFEGEDIVSYSDLSAFSPDVWMVGHWHKDQGITEIAPNKWVVNIGSLTRGSLSQDEVSRIPSVCLASFDKNRALDLKKIPLTVEPPEKIFDLVGRQRMDVRETSMDSFIVKFKDALIRADEQSSLEDSIRQMELDDEVKEMALFYLETKSK